MLDQHGARKTINILTKSLIFGRALKERKTILEMSYQASKFKCQVTEILENQASLFSEEVMENSALRDSIIRVDQKYYLVE